MWSSCGEWDGHNECSVGHNRSICILAATMSLLLLWKAIKMFSPACTLKQGKNSTTPSSSSCLEFLGMLPFMFEKKTLALTAFWWRNFNTFLHTIINTSWFLDSSTELRCVGGTWLSPSKCLWWILLILAQLIEPTLPPKTLQDPPKLPQDPSKPPLAL